MKVKLIAGVLGVAVIGSAFAEPTIYEGVSVAPQPSSATQMPVHQQLQILQQTLDNMKQMNFPEKIQQLERQLQMQQGTIEVLEHKVDALQKQQSLQYQDLVAQIKKSEAKPSSASAAVALNAAAPQSMNMDVQGTVAVSPDEQDRRTYQSAYSLVTSQQYQEAIKAFQGYLQIYGSEGRYSANAYYWLGELYAQQKQYDQAVRSLQTVVSDFPQSNKVPDALLKLGVVAIAKGDQKTAQGYFNQVITGYGDTGSARLAKQQLEQISAR